jgi:peptide/nickel transport system substrate-binding protein
LSAEPDTLNPITSTDVYASRINSFLFDSLIERNNETLAFEPKLAERWEISDDKKFFTFYLRKGVKWHDGTPVTIEDIIYSFNRIMDPKVASPHLRVYYQEIESVTKVAPGIVRFKYKRPYFMALNFCGGIPILPRHLYELSEDFNRSPQSRAPVGNGPYRFVHWKTGRSIRLERNPDYWGEKPAIKDLEFRIVAEDTVTLQILKKGRLDFAGLRPIQWVKQTNSKKFNQKFEKYKYYTPGYSFIGWNLRRPYFKDKKVRRALTHLINRKAILETISFGLGKVVTGPFYTEGIEYDRTVKPLPYDPERAYQLLREAGWVDNDGDGVRERDGVPFAFEFLIPSGRRFTEQLSTIIKEDFRKAGIEVTIQKLEWALFTLKLNDRSFDAVTLGWSFGFEQDPYQVWHSSQVERGSNFVGFADENADRWIDQGRVTFDREKRAKLYHKLHRLIHEEQPYTFLFASPALVALNRRFENVKVYPIGLDPLEWTVSEELQ